MKLFNTVIFLLIGAVLLCLSGCESLSSSSNGTEASDTAETSTTESVTDLLPSETQEADTASSTEETLSGEDMPPNSDSLMSTGYFESLCEADRLHNMITATYTGYTFDRNGCFELSFQVHSLHVGLEVGDTVRAVYYPSDVFSTDPNDIVFTEGETYLILLTRYRNVYEAEDGFQVIGSPSLLIPVNDFQSSTLYGTPLADHVAGMDVTESTTVEEFISYIQSITTENQQFSGQDYIQTNARVDIMTASPYVVTVTTSSVTSSMSTLTVTLRCRVDSVQKGSLKIGEYIDIMFPLDVNIGLNETFIITLNDPLPSGMNWYRFSCKQAIYPLSEAESIMAIINDDHVSE